MRLLSLFLSLAACAFAQSESFNHVQWTMTLDQTSAAPGATVLAHLEARVDPDWHMYSLTTPPGPIPTTIKTVNGNAIANVTFFEPPPIRKYDANFQADTETYEGTQVFLARIELKKDVAPGDVTLAFQPRYQTCSGTQCIPARTRDLTAVLKVVAGKRGDGRGSVERRRNPRVSRRRVRRWAGLHLYAVCFPDDPHHDVVLHGTTRGRGAGGHVLPGHRRLIYQHGTRDDAATWPFRRDPTRIESMGERLHFADLFRLRTEPAGRI